MRGATTSRTSRRTARHHPQRPDVARALLDTSAGLSARAPGHAKPPRRSMIAHSRNSRAWIGICDETGPFTDQGRRAVVWAPHILLGALGVEGSDIPQHPPEGASP